MGSPTIHTPTLLVIDDEPDNLNLLAQTRDQNWRVLVARSGLEALTILHQQGEVSVIIVDLKAIGNDAEVLRQIERQYPDTMQIVRSASSTIDGLNAFRYVQRSWHEIELKELVNQAIATHHILRSRTAELRHALRQQSLLNAIAMPCVSSHF